ncbi:MAG: family lipolytic protein [Flaviaesturariibacter sp.]|nr:family lipolytic protein [Flaviaesturariibacter sp.]
MKRFATLLLIGLVCYVNIQAQSAPPFWADITAFKKSDSTHKIAERTILFVGSSSFTKWKELSTDFPGFPVLNRGFGGSTLLEVIRYAYDIIIPYNPKQVIIYCGENDLASADSISVSEVVKRVKTLYGIIRTNLPDATIDFVSIKPSPVRASIQGKVKAANKEIKAFFKGQKRAAFIDIYAAMLDEQGEMREELYVSDRLHMKPEGYAIWKRIIEPYLIK